MGVTSHIFRKFFHLHPVVNRILWFSKDIQSDDSYRHTVCEENLCTEKISLIRDDITKVRRAGARLLEAITSFYLMLSASSEKPTTSSQPRSSRRFSFPSLPYSVAVPPHKPNIIDEHGKAVPAVAGPYEEGGDMRLQCLVSGGKPYFP